MQCFGFDKNIGQGRQFGFGGLIKIALTDFILLGNGAEAVDYAIKQLAPNGSGWSVDVDNRAITYTETEKNLRWQVWANKGVIINPMTACTVLTDGGATCTEVKVVGNSVTACYQYPGGGKECGEMAYRINPDGSPATKPISRIEVLSIDIVVEKIILNAESGHYPSQVVVELTS